MTQVFPASEMFNVGQGAEMGSMIVQQCEHRQLEYVRCPKCGWQGTRKEVREDTCPRCSSKDLQRM
jgi:ssDNA-binding Zn-finger/Zn-ribbon topoisomerase 1